MKNKEQGQSIIEFLMTITLLMAFCFLFLKIALNYTNGYVVHYANYMASRAYLVIDRNSNEPSGSDNEALTRARSVFDKYNIGAMISGFTGELDANSPEEVSRNAFVGTLVEYSDIFSFSALMGGKTNVNFISESFLGREPTRAECVERICRMMQELGSDCEYHVTLDDNGC
jgi:hypothetical protein